jgi:hypothetical protein
MEQTKPAAPSSERVVDDIEDKQHRAMGSEFYFMAP